MLVAAAEALALVEAPGRAGGTFFYDFLDLLEPSSEILCDGGGKVLTAVRGALRKILEKLTAP